MVKSSDFFFFARPAGYQTFYNASKIERYQNYVQFIKMYCNAYTFLLGLQFEVHRGINSGIDLSAREGPQFDTKGAIKPFDALQKECGMVMNFDREQPFVENYASKGLFILELPG